MKQERIEVFMENLNQHLQESGYKDTVLYDPSGYDMKAHTTVWDMKKVTDRLLENPWFREMVSQHMYGSNLFFPHTYINEKGNFVMDKIKKSGSNWQDIARKEACTGRGIGVAILDTGE